MVISKPIRRNKKTTKSVVLVEPPRRISTHDRIINVLKDYEGKINSMGNLHHTIKFMVRAGEIKKEKCPHCSSTELYKLHI